MHAKPATRFALEYASLSSIRERLHPRALFLLGVLILVDAVFILGDVVELGLHYLGFNVDLSARIDLGWERSYPSDMMYLEWLAVAVLLYLVWWRNRDLAYFAVASVFLLILVDDYIEIHEWTGKVLGGHASNTADAIGELVGFGLLAVLAAALLATGWVRGRKRGRLHMIVFVSLIGLIALFAVGVDFVHALAQGISDDRWRLPLADFGAVLEDGGELVFASLTVVYALHVFLTVRSPSS